MTFPQMAIERIPRLDRWTLEELIARKFDGRPNVACFDCHRPIDGAAFLRRGVGRCVDCFVLANLRRQ